MRRRADTRTTGGRGESLVVDVSSTPDSLTVELADGHTLTVPLAWFPRLLDATAQARANWRPVGRGRGIHWDDVDEDISVDGLLAGRRSGESDASLARWLAARKPAVAASDRYSGSTSIG